VVIVLAVIALVGGTTLGAGTRLFGGGIAPLARELTGALPASGPPPATAPAAVAGASVAACVLAAVLGVVLARRVAGASSAPPWLIALGQPYAILAWSLDVVGRGLRFLERSVRAMDRDVIDDVPAALGDVVRKLGRVMWSRRGGAKVEPPLEDGAGAVVMKLEVGDPRAAERTRLLVLFAMMALLGLVVLSSFILR
jgi:hypothetical protein